MQILLIAATEAEIKPFADKNYQVDILVTGVGCPATLYHLQKRVHQMDYDLVIQAGVAGTFTDRLAPGSVVAVQQDCFADLGFEEQQIFTPLCHTGFLGKDEYPFSNGWLMNTGNNLPASDLPWVKGITVNKVSDSSLQLQQYTAVYDADIETMEGAALHYIGLQEQIPFLQVRAISNRVGERDKSKWVLREAIDNLNRELESLVTGYIKQFAGR